MDTKPKRMELAIKIVKIIIALGLAGLTAFTIYTVNFRPFLHGRYLVKASSLMQSDFELALDYYVKALNYSSQYNRDVRFFTAEGVIFGLEAGNISAPDKDTRLKSILLLKAVKTLMEKNISVFDIKYLASHDILAKTYEMLYFLEEQKNEEYLESALAIIRRAQNFNSAMPAFYRLSGEIKFLQKKYDEGLEDFNKALETGKEDLFEFYRALGIAYLRAGEREKGILELKKAIEIGFQRGDTKLFLVWKLSDIYARAGDLRSVAELYETAIEHYPDKKNKDYFQLYASLAAAYAKMGNREKAEETAQKMLELNPALRGQVEEFLEEL